MLVFSPKWIQPILSGQKTVTLRKWPTARVKEGGVYDAVTLGFPRKSFAKLRVLKLSKIRIGDIDETRAKRDGAKSAEEVRNYWMKQGFNDSKELWLIEFQLHRP